ncbi:uncharacterized protein LOC117147873 [Drosophila mauritiana]|uniref:Uncharacterized protein LOC117147873 n=1 Tax=Drosophila mauritiana TaxID=7226 RepID=A0A6P8L4S7_DROMA|nr:uncharacterized protein LOC117147873 [Drosophila mauritiana]
MDRNKPLRLIGLSSIKPEKNPKLTLSRLYQLPALCPIEKCIATVSKDDMLQHLAQYHFQSNVRKHMQVAFNGERCTLVFDVSQLIGAQTICLGVLLYGGARGKNNQLPGERQFCSRNILKPGSELVSLTAHLPIMVLARRITFLSWAFVDRNIESDVDLRGQSVHSGQEIKNQKKTVKAEQEEILDSDLLIIWTQSAPCIRPLHVAMTVFNRTLTVGRSAILSVANSGQMYTELRGKDLPKDRHALLLTQADLKEICGAEHHLHLELILNESSE